MTLRFKSAAAAVVLAVAATAIGAATPAQAGGRATFELSFSDGYRFDRGYRRDRWHRPRFRSCRPRRALRKARRLGVRRAYVHRFGRRGVVVRGRSFGDHVVVRFGRARHCPIVALHRR